MFGPPFVANSVYVTIVPTGCCQSEFDPTYPVHLNGVIHPDEYKNSIGNINRAMSFKKAKIVCTIIFFVCLVAAIALFVAGVLTSDSSRSTSFRIMALIAAGLFALGIVTVLISCCVIRSKRSTRLREAVAKESVKYFNRSPTPCSWRLHANRMNTSAFHSRQDNHLTYQLVIDIGSSAPPGYGYAPHRSNQVGPESARYDSFNSNPPAYGQAAEKC